MSVFSGVIPVFTVLPGSSLNSSLNQVAQTLIDSTIGVAVNATLGEEAAKFLGLPGKNSNFFGPIANEQFLSQGIQGLSQSLNNSLIGSNALGPLGPLGTKLIGLGARGLNNLVSDAFRRNNDGAPVGGTLYFPGAGGIGEGAAYWGSENRGVGKLPPCYSLGKGGPDIVFKIVAAAEAATFEAQKGTQAPPTPNTNRNTATTGGNPSTQPTSNPGTTPPKPVKNPATPTGSGAGGAAPAPAPASTKTPGPTPAVKKNIPRSQRVDSPSTVIPPKTQPQTPAAYQGVASNNSQTVAGTSKKTVGTSGGNNINPVPNKGESDKNQNKGEAKKLTQPAGGWMFVCTPDDISWEKSFQANRTEMWGTNLPPVVGGSVSMRDLTLSNSIVEGFSRGVNVEEKISSLERLCGVSSTTGGRRDVIQIPVYRVYAGEKYYGKVTTGDINGGGFFIIKSVKVQEMIRDLTGKTVRAKVDVSLMQVPGYQVESGRDMASAFLPSRLSAISDITNTVEARTRGAIGPLAQANQSGAAGAPAAQAPEVRAADPRGGGVRTAPGPQGSLPGTTGVN